MIDGHDRNIQVYVYPNSRLIINSGDFHVGSVTDEGGDIVLGSGNLWLHD